MTVICVTVRSLSALIGYLSRREEHAEFILGGGGGASIGINFASTFFHIMNV